MKSRALLLWSVLFILILPSCKENEDPAPSIEINNWISEVLNDVYLWNTLIPENQNKSLSPEAFFKSLLYAGDRFSVIYESADELKNLLNGVKKEAGYEFTFIRENNGSDNLIAVILYIKPNSPASEKGLKRGDVITKINNSIPTVSNYRALIGQLSESHEIEYNTYNPISEKYQNQTPITVGTVVYVENPDFLQHIYTLENGTKVGYYVYNFFDNGSNENNEYHKQMDDIIANFKANGVTELIIDLRYNGGGLIQSATNMASLLGKGITSSDVFFEQEYNNSSQAFYTDKFGAEALKQKFLEKTQNIGSSLGSNSIYFLISGRSASSSELVINGLKPYMNVVLIGETTVGKNVGSIFIEDTKNENNNYGLLPIVLRTVNANGNAEYEAGFKPDYEVKDVVLPLKALGDLSEPLLSKAIELISGEPVSTAARISDAPSYHEVYSSIKERHMILSY